MGGTNKKIDEKSTTVGEIRTAMQVLSQLTLQRSQPITYPTPDQLPQTGTLSQIAPQPMDVAPKGPFLGSHNTSENELFPFIHSTPSRDVTFSQFNAGLEQSGSVYDKAVSQAFFPDTNFFTGPQDGGHASTMSSKGQGSSISSGGGGTFSAQGGEPAPLQSTNATALSTTFTAPEATAENSDPTGGRSNNLSASIVTHQFSSSRFRRS
jgi:hypothetical protein